MSEDRILTGNEDCTLGALAAGMNFFAGYPITPATEIAETASEMLPKHGGKYMQMEGRAGLYRGGYRGICCRCQGHGRHQRSGCLPDAGEPELRHGGRDPLSAY